MLYTDKINRSISTHALPVFSSFQRSEGGEIYTMPCRAHTFDDVRLALDAYTKLKSFRKVERSTGISKSTVHRWWSKFRTLRLDVSRSSRRRKPRTRAFDHCVQTLEQIIEPKNFVTLQAIQEELRTVHDVVPSLSTIRRMLKALKIKRRVVNTKITNKNPDKLSEQIERFKDQIAGVGVDNVVSVDESCFCTHANKFKIYSKTPRTVKVEKRGKKSFVLGITARGIPNDDCFEARDKPFTKASFLEFFDRMLARLPKRITHVLMDNIAFHHSRVVKEAAKRRGVHIIYSPPYSPQFNPIENVFAVMKHAFRKEFLVTKDLDKSLGVSIRHIKEKQSFHSTFTSCMRRES